MRILGHILCPDKEYEPGKKPHRNLSGFYWIDVYISALYTFFQE
jgi:hypothetical protein